MNVSVPLGIENYLLESGFTATEVILLKKLLEENLLTMRELATKTGKGNGVIDAALKKLMKRGIVVKEQINDYPKYRVIDPEAIIGWAKKNLKEYTDMMERKHESFTHFIQHLTVENSHPEIEHFSGPHGFMKAYDKLLDNRTELLTYFDPATIAASDALTDFRLQYARRRQVHGIFQRVIAPDSPLARRFRTRDPFEHRQTILVPPENFPMSFQKIIAGDTIACMDSNTMSASFIRFGKLAESERNAFERLWSEQIERDRAAQPLTQNTDETVISPMKYQFTMNTPQKICVAYTGLLCIFWAGIFFTHTIGGFYGSLYGLLFGLIPLSSGPIAILNIKMWGGLKTAIGKAVFFMGLGIFLWGIGSMVWSYYNFFLNNPSPYPSIADIAYVPSVFLYAFGVIYLSDATGAKIGLRNMYAKIFIVIAPLITLAASYYILVTVARGGVLITTEGSILKMILDIVYPLEDFLGLTIAVLISGLSFKYMEGKYTFDIVAILLGLAVMFVADFIFSYTTTVGTSYNGDLGDLVFTLALFFLSFGILGFSKEKPVVARQETLPLPVTQEVL